MFGFKWVYAPVKISDMVFHTKLGFVNHSVAACDSGKHWAGMDRTAKASGSRKGDFECAFC
jgi:hypothetical protein